MFRWMEEEELAIRKLEGMKMIHFYSLFSNGRDVPAVAVAYGEHQQINYSSLDPWYSLTLERILERYPVEKEDHLIVMDDHTRGMLELLTSQNGRKMRTLDIPWLKDAEELTDPLYSAESYMFSMIAPMAEYLMGELYRMFGRTLSLHGQRYSWHKKGSIVAKDGEKETIFPVTIQRVSEDEYLLWIGQFIEPQGRLQLRVIFHPMGVKLLYTSEEYALVGASLYDYQPESGCIREDISVSVADTTVFESVEELACEKTTDPCFENICRVGLQMLLPQMDRVRSFLLPWKQYYLVDHRSQVSEIAVRNDYETGWFGCDQAGAFLKRSSFSVIQSLVNGMQLHQIGYYAEGYAKYNRKGQQQIHFKNAGFHSVGEYKQEYEGKYFLLADDKDMGE